MLLELEIRDLAIFESARAEFGEGLCCLTGESGSGKSVFLSALALLQGSRADSDLVRRGATKATIQARFRLPNADHILEGLLADLGVQSEEGELLLTREIQAGGRSRVRIGGVSATLRDLESISRRLFDLHGQHAQQRLLADADHSPLLTSLAGQRDLASAMREAVVAWKKAREQLREYRTQAEEAERNREFIEFQHRELADAKLQPHEDATLEHRLQVVSQAGQIAQWVDQSRAILSDDGALEKPLAALARSVGKLVQTDASLGFLEEHLAEIRSHLAELSAGIEAYEVPESLSPAQIDAMNARLARFQKLKARHRVDFEGLIALRDRLDAQLRQVQDSGAELQHLQQQQDKARHQALELAARLSVFQREAAARLDAAVTGALGDLGMAGASFRTRLEELSDPGPDGMLKAIFELSPNPGEGWRDLAEVASGGEASRIMLAIESHLAEADPVPLLIFDEVDAGLSGTVAHRVGTALLGLSSRLQVVAITHLHQVASVANHHLSIRKSVQDGRTRSGVVALDGEDRLDEICRMLGNPADPTVRAHARALLEGSR